MFYEQLSMALDGNRSTGWLRVAKQLKMTPDDLRMKIESESLTFEECILATNYSGCPELLQYVLRLFDSSFMMKGKMDIGDGKMMKVNVASSRMN